MKPSYSNIQSRYAHLLGLCLLSILVAGLSGCGSTKVYTSQKSVVYNGNIYNLGNTQRVGSRIDGLQSDGETVNMRGMDRKGVEALLDANDSLMVSAVVEFDQTEMVYQRIRITKYSEYSKLVKRFDRALNDISKFMGNKKSTQLKLK
ncbi:MAG: hypothetical protein HKP03_08685 [Xanthomonadales bacterium]|nr:hypothetical protein [Xanthomonadales bacterium]